MKSTEPLPADFTVTAHTGCEGTPDNSLAAIDRAYESGADIVEIDLQYDAAGTPVLSHNTPAGGEPTLAEAFEKLAAYGNMRMNVDVKTTAHLHTVQILAERSDVLSRIFFTGVGQKDVPAVKAAAPEIPYYLNANVLPRTFHTQIYLRLLAKRVKKTGAVGINFHYNGASAALVNVFHKNGLLVSVWTVNNEEDMRRILTYGPDNVTTREPSLLRGILSEKKA
ncbi:MAG: glycerophosphodiester phosphodiesterase [Clostridia bacterium]|nr:glycerophosphodiester phosphodiesterase [Clostridia bacterium]